MHKTYSVQSVQPQYVRTVENYNQQNSIQQFYNQDSLIRPNDDANGLTVTWDINAHVVQKPNILTRIKNRLGKGPMPENAQNGYVKQILRNGN
jgi:hypothetical protein